MRLKKGTVCEICYAAGGFYRMGPVKDAMDIRLAASRHPLWPDAMASLIYGLLYFRWFDSGDIQSLKMLYQIVEIAKNLPRTKFWLPTKELAIVRRYLKENPEGFPENLVVRVSMTMVDPRHMVKTESLFNTSTTSEKKKPEGFLCTAETREEKCVYCRACWDKNVPNVIYPVRKKSRELCKEITVQLEGEKND